MTTQTALDTADQYAWSQKVSVFDAQGFLIGETFTFDDGRIRTSTIVDGVRVGLKWSDPADGFDWTSRTSVYDKLTGLLTFQGVMLDSGVHFSSTYNGGVIASRITSDISDAFAWTSMVHTFDNFGCIASSLVTLDDRRIVLTDYVDGIKSQKFVTDVADGYSWSSKIYDYDDTTGSLLTISTVFDDGSTSIHQPASGPLGQIITLLDSANAFSWTSRATTYDASGAVVAQTRLNDDGTQSITQFSGGVRTQVTWTDGDNGQPWHEKTFTFDAGGRVAGSDVMMDDGRQIVQTYQDGVRTMRTVTDTADIAGWATITQQFDSEGLIASRSVVSDNGDVTTRTYSGGILQEKLRSDGPDAHSWESIRSVYDGDNGALLYVHRTLDDGTQTFVDVRGKAIITGGTQAGVVEDASAVLQAMDTIDVVAGYRGASDFTAIASIAGDNGYGTFTLGTGGSWTYEAINNQTAIQGLNTGDTLTDSFTATTTDDVSTTVTVTIAGTDYFDGPVFAGDVVQAVGAAGSTAPAGHSLDLNTLFTHDDGEAMTYAIADLPAGLTLTNGILTVTDHTAVASAGDYPVAVTATDAGGTSITQSLSLAVAVHNDFGDDFGLNSAETVAGTSFGDTITIGSDAGGNTGSVTVDGGAGADTITFGDGAENLSIDLGADADVDTLIFLGTVENATISNWEQGVDVVDVASVAGWTVSDDGTDTTLSDGVSDITFVDTTGLTDLGDFLV
ncbi:VCBS domain-containing protein [Pelagimonas varians]|uniref:Cadherin domain-containing protein n=1 Tax=Pelagimonas varians TaxID=696760 RepID=A0A238KT00_9RHOB|nr:VCBS domain-containing protein [Pelagimonas varians]PYG32565.1 VCBS repeat-containing protein [Pelagimonas varians]SMX45964.1 hypothetical protein PEV8663_03158 [Pelagimonas varians]